MVRLIRGRRFCPGDEPSRGNRSCKSRLVVTRRLAAFTTRSGPAASPHRVVRTFPRWCGLSSASGL